jgi:hypothetical protein
MPYAAPHAALRSVVALSLVLVLIGQACLPRGLAQAPEAIPALVRIALSGAEDVERVVAQDLPVLAQIDTPEGGYLLAVLAPQEQTALGTMGLSAHVLDADARGATYYWVSWRGHRPSAPCFDGSVLYDDGTQVLVRAPVHEENLAISALGDANLVLQRLGPDPIVLAAPGLRLTSAIPTTALYDPLVAAVIAPVSDADLAAYVGDLSGEHPVMVGGQAYTITTRYTTSGEPLLKATQYVYERLQALGYVTQYQAFYYGSYALRNVIAEKRGRTHPEQVLLLTAHLDSRAVNSPHNPAPGADDNASGCAALLVAAERLAEVDLADTVRLAFFTAEEQGMIGSSAYAAQIAAAHDLIRGVVNLDMIGWDTKGGPDIDLHTTQRAAVRNDSHALAELFANVIAAYQIHLVPQIVENGTSSSDHSSFWNSGYPAILGIEDYVNPSESVAEPHDWNTHYHSLGDRLSTLNLTYLREYTRATLATLVHLAVPLRTLQGSVTSAASGVALAAEVDAMGAEGNYATHTDSVGHYALILPGGTFTVTASSIGYCPQTIASVAVVTGTETTLDLALVSLATATPSAVGTLPSPPTVPAPTSTPRYHFGLPLVLKRLPMGSVR